MTPGTTASSRSGVRVRVVGPGSHAAAVKSALDDDFHVIRNARSSPADAGFQSPDADCFVYVASERTTPAVVREALGGLVAGGPVVAVLSEPDDDVVDAAFEAGAVDVARELDESFPDRVAWVCRGDLTRSAGRNGIGDLAGGLDTFGDAACLLDAQWRVQTATPAFGDLVGRSSSALAGETLWSAWSSSREAAEVCWRAVLDDERVEFELSADDARRLEAVATPLADGLALRLDDVTERVSAVQSVDRYERILETIDDGIYTLDENFRILSVNEAVTEMTGYSREELVGAHSTLLADEDVIVDAWEVIQAILSGERTDGRLDVELRTADGDTLPVETRFSALRFGDGSYGSVGVIRDIRDRKRFERTLTALNSSARQLFQSETKPAVGETIVDTATEVLELESVVVYLFSEAEGRLEPAAWKGDGTPKVVRPGNGLLWDCFIDRDSAILERVDGPLDGWEDLAPVDVDEREDGGGGLALPLGPHGLLVTASSTDDPPRGQDMLTRLLAANAEAALDRVERSMELARRKEKLAERNEDLSRLNRFNELLREVNRVLVEADTREEIEQAVCERLVDGSSIAFAWIGSYDHISESLAPRTWAGAERGYLDFLVDPDADVTDEPSLVTSRTGEVTVVDNVAEQVQSQSWRRNALSREFTSVASVPLVYHEFSYGVLTVYAAEPNTFDDPTRRMFEELGVTTANAINGAEAKESLHTESIVELDLRVTSPNAPLRRMADAVASELRLEGSVPQSDGSTLLYLTVAAPDADVAALSSLAAVDEVREIVDRDGGQLVEVRTAVQTVPSRLADLGGNVRRLVVDDEALDVLVELPPGLDVREYVETVQEAYPGTELRAKRTRERMVETPRAFRANMEEALTERQFEALRTAFYSGYFTWPRERTGRDIAESLDISQPTFARHLRVAERKLLELLLEE
jgi:PAS domain S-box-containing protein